MLRLRNSRIFSSIHTPAPRISNRFEKIVNSPSINPSTATNLSSSVSVDNQRFMQDSYNLCSGETQERGSAADPTDDSAYLLQCERQYGHQHGHRYGPTTIFDKPWFIFNKDSKRWNKNIKSFA